MPLVRHPMTITDKAQSEQDAYRRQTMPVMAARPATKSMQDSRLQLEELDQIAEGKLA